MIAPRLPAARLSGSPTPR